MTTTLESADIPTAADSGAQVSALLRGAGVAPLDDTGWIRVTGEDRVRWLNGMVTNSIQDLAPGEGCYNFVLNAQGRIQGDLNAFALPDSILLGTAADQVEKLLAHLNHFIIMDDVELADISESRRGLGIAGPNAAKLIAAIDLSSEDNLEPLELVHVTWHSASIDLIRAHSPLIPKLEIWSDPATFEIVRNQLLITGATPISPDALNQLRILEGTPRYGVDIRNSEAVRDLPQETAQTRALHFTKGCYLGQEIVERIRSRGNVHRTFTGFELAGALPAAGTGTVLTAEGKPAGEITSIAAIQLPPSASAPASAKTVQLALGYVRREALDRRLTLEYPGGVATPIALPYPIS
jgi:folate-binding protein YgfZ